MNIVVISGYIGQDAESRGVNVKGEQKTVTEFSVATKWGQKTSWHDVTCWGQTAEFCANLKKGSRVIVSGRIESETAKNDKGTFKTYKITANQVDVVTRMEIRPEAPKEDTSRFAAGAPGVDDVPF